MEDNKGKMDKVRGIRQLSKQKQSMTKHDSDQ